MFLKFQNELILLSLLKVIKINTNVRRSRTTLNRKYFKT